MPTYFTPPTPTYIPLATITLASADSEIVFSSIPAGYRDLILVVDGIPTASTSTIGARFNSDSGSNYTYVEAGGNGSVTYSSAGSFTGNIIGFLTTAARIQMQLQVMDYSVTDKFKTSLVRQSAAGEAVAMRATRWANTAAVTSISVFTSSSTFAIGSTFSLFGIAG